MAGQKMLAIIVNVIVKSIITHLDFDITEMMARFFAGIVHRSHEYITGFFVFIGL
jgi:hypothetical protein